MVNEEKRPLKVFLCHASGDKPAVHALYKCLVRDGVDAWLDKEKLLPGQDWRLEIPKAVQESDVVVVCLSNKSITKEGYVQKEIKFALDSADEKPKGTIFLIPARLEECEVPSQLSLWQWVDLFESDGYEWLMRSLRLRADKLGLHFGDLIYTDEEFGQRLDQLYTEGLAALWVEDWDKACLRFQTILREKPDHMQAAAKLEEAKRQKHLSALYIQALNAHESGNWQVMVEVLEKLTGEVADYKDAFPLLKNARRENQLTHLYDEACRLYKAQQWDAVTRVFAQIAAIEPNYQDPDGLLSSAESEVAELKRLARLNELYSQGVREMDAGHWYEARMLLEQVHKTQTGFLETEGLLRKVEDKIVKIEEFDKRNIYINTLYEQAHELVRAKKWRKALDKIEEIQKLDERFVDRDGIFERVRAELAREEEVVQRQNELAAMYAETVGILKEGKYQEALNKLNEVRAIDPKYPDRQSIQKIARKKLTEAARSLQSRPQVLPRRLVWTRIVGPVVISAVVITAIIFVIRGHPSAKPSSTGSIVPTSTLSPTAKPSSTGSIVPTSTLSPMAYDNFENTVFDGEFNTDLWSPVVSSPNYIEQRDGILILLIEPNSETSVSLFATEKMSADQYNFAEAKVLLSSNLTGQDARISFGMKTIDANGNDLIFACGISNFSRGSQVETSCEVYRMNVGADYNLPGNKITDYDVWHTFRIQIDPEMDAFFYVDGLRLGSYKPKDAEELKSKVFTVVLGVWSPSQEGIEAHFDDVRIGQYK